MRGLLIGRFQPFHSGHLEVIRHIRKIHGDEPLVLGVGSAQESYTLDNPFTAGERQEMIGRALGASAISNWSAVPIPDIQRHALWVAHVRELVPPFGRVYTNNPLTRLLFEREQVEVEATPLFDRKSLEGSAIRRRIADGAEWRSLVTEPVARYLDEIDGPGRIRLLARK